MTADAQQASRDRERIDAALEREGFTPDAWEVEDGRPVALVGRFHVVEGDDNSPPYLDADGELRVSVVGAQEYRNERIYWAFREDGMDADDEVHDLATIEPLDE